MRRIVASATLRPVQHDLTYPIAALPIAMHSRQMNPRTCMTILLLFILLANLVFTISPPLQNISVSGYFHRVYAWLPLLYDAVLEGKCKSAVRTCSTYPESAMQRRKDESIKPMCTLALRTSLKDKATPPLCTYTIKIARIRRLCACIYNTLMSAARVVIAPSCTGSRLSSEDASFMLPNETPRYRRESTGH